MTKCSFCGKEEQLFKGIHLIKNDGSILYFCSSKCRKNALKLGRDRRKLKWTEAYRLAREKARVKHAKKEAVIESAKKGEAQVGKEKK